MEEVWNFKLCEVCLKNAHQKVEMKKRLVVSTDEDGEYQIYMWVCPVCGATKRV